MNLTEITNGRTKEFLSFFHKGSIEAFLLGQGDLQRTSRGRPGTAETELRAELEKLARSSKKSTKIGVKEEKSATIVRSDRISIRKIECTEVEFEVESLCGMLAHQWDAKTKAGLGAKHRGELAESKTPQVPRDDWNGARYMNHSGADGIPAHFFKHCITRAAALLKDKSLTQELVKGAIVMKPGLVLLDFRGEKKNTETAPYPCGPCGYPEMLEHIVRVGGFQGKPMLRYRPHYAEWQSTVQLRFDSSVLTIDQISGLLDRGGFYTGVGDWRPEKNGDYGRFHVVNVRNGWKK